MTTTSSSGPRAAGKSRAGGSVQCVHSDGWQPADTYTPPPSHFSVPLLAGGDASLASNQLRREGGSGPRLNSGRKEERPPAQATADNGGGQSATEGERRKTLEDGKKAEEERFILAIADEHLDQASSLLSSVRRDQRGAGEEGGLPLALDIETNIGRLEETRERIGNAIEIYQAVQERRGEVGDESYPPPLSHNPNVTFQATVNVEHKVRKELKEVVITRTSRGRRSGVEDDRREGQLWEGKLGGGSAPGEFDTLLLPRHNLALLNSKKSQPRLTLVIFCKQTQNHGGEVTNSAAPAVAKTTRAAKSSLKIGQSIASPPD